LTEEKQQPRTSFSQRVLIGVGLGIAVGLFVGERAAPLKAVGDAYVGLLQMTVLPYVFVSLIGNIAKLSLGGGKLLIRRAGLTLLCLWGIGLVSLPIVALSFPAWEVGSFFSTSFLEESPSVDYQALYIPSNPFNSLANNLVPAVALFCILAGAVAISMPRKDRLVELLDLLTDLLTRLNRVVVRLTPIGVFGIAASAAGTLTVQQFGLLQGYLMAHAIGVGLLVFGGLPLFVTSVTPLTYREVLGAAKDPLLTAFVTGSTFVTLPMIVENTKALLESKGLGGTEANPEVIVPLAYPFPHLGKIMSLIFVPFAAWFYGSSMSLADFPNFLATGLFGAFGSLVITIPMLLEQQHLPADIFQLFLLSGVVAARVADMLGSMHILAFALITTYGMAGKWKLRPRRLLVGMAVIGGAAFLLIGGTRYFLQTTFLDDYEKQDPLGSMVSVEPQVEVIVLEEAVPNPVPLQAGQSRLARIRERGVIRIGTATDHLPFAFLNADGHLVGFDVDMAHRLALDLRVKLELVPVEAGRIQEQLAADHCDLVMAGIEATVRRAETLYLSDPYLHVTAAAVVLDHREKEFSSMAKIEAMEDLRVAVSRSGHAAENVFRRVSHAEVVEISTIREFFEGGGGFDVLAVSAEIGSAWTLRYPEYTVLKSLERRVRVPLAYPIAGRDEELQAFINDWLELRKSSGVVDRLFDYWVLGKGAETHELRWSVLRDVLGWVN